MSGGSSSRDRRYRDWREGDPGEAWTRNDWRNFMSNDDKSRTPFSDFLDFWAKKYGAGSDASSPMMFNPVYPPGLTDQLGLGFNPDFVNSLVQPMPWQPTFGLHGAPKAPKDKDKDKKR